MNADEKAAVEAILDAVAGSVPGGYAEKLLAVRRARPAEGDRQALIEARNDLVVLLGPPRLMQLLSLAASGGWPE